jgi:hypothetical protein
VAELETAGEMDGITKVHSKISLQFQVLRRPSGKAGERLNIRIFRRFPNAAGRDGSAHENVKNVKLFLSKP